MYCKHCGKEIADDSKFCQHCGERQFDVESKNDESNEKIIQIHNIARDDYSSQVNVVNKGKNKNNIIANEIIGNLKMIGLAASFVALYLLGFRIIHFKDISKYDYETKNSFFGESCYDPSVITGTWMLHWEQHYYKKLYFALYNHEPFFIDGIPSAEECLKSAKELEKEYENKVKLLEWEINSKPQMDFVPDKEVLEKAFKKGYRVEGVATDLDIERHLLLNEYNPKKLKEEAKADAARDIERFNWEINNYRESGFKKDLKNNALYATLISLIIFIFGRYLVKLTKWTKANRTE